MRKFGTVEEAFNITRWGGGVFCLFPEFYWRVQRGFAFELRRAETTIFRSSVHKTDVPRKLDPRPMVAIIAEDLDPDLVVAGDEIWLEDAAFVQLGSSH